MASRAGVSATPLPAASVTVAVELSTYKTFTDKFKLNFPTFQLGVPSVTAAGKDFHFISLSREQATILIDSFNTLAEVEASQPVLARTSVPLREVHMRLVRPQAGPKGGTAARGAGAKPAAKDLERPLLPTLPACWTAAFTRITAPYLRSAGIRPLIVGERTAGPVPKAGIYLGCDPLGVHAAAQVRHLALALGLRVEPPPPASHVEYRLLCSGELADWAAAVTEFGEAATRICGRTEVVRWPSRATVAVGLRHAAFETAVGDAVRGHRVVRVDPGPTEAKAARDTHLGVATTYAAAAQAAS